MKCSRCEQDNPEGRHFCSECGTSLARACISCGFPNEPEAEFCGGCGISVSSAAPDLGKGFQVSKGPASSRLSQRILALVTPASSERTLVFDPKLVGLHGWLVIVGFWLVAAPAQLLGSLAMIVASLTWARNRLPLQLLLSIELLVFIGLLAWLFWLIYLFFMKRRRFPSLAVRFLIAQVAVS